MIFMKKLLDGIGRDIILLLIRISMIFIFFKSGMLKWKDWENTLFLFELEYAVPILPFEWSAYIATFFEIFMPLFILAGLFTRLACLPLLGITLVIQFVLGHADPAYNQLGHYHWMLLLGVLMCFGAGKISIDWLLCKIVSYFKKPKKEVIEEEYEEPLELT